MEKTLEEKFELAKRFNGLKKSWTQGFNDGLTEAIHINRQHQLEEASKEILEHLPKGPTKTENELRMAEGDVYIVVNKKLRSWYAFPEEVLERVLTWEQSTGLRG